MQSKNEVLASEVGYAIPRKTLCLHNCKDHDNLVDTLSRILDRVEYIADLLEQGHK